MIGALSRASIDNRLVLKGSVFSELPATSGRDLLETLYGGWLDQPLWEHYRVPGPVVGCGTAELRTYRSVARAVRAAMDVAMAKSRSGTEYRIASAIVGELAESASWNVTTRAIACQCRHTEFVANLAAVYAVVLTGQRRELEAALREYRSVERRQNAAVA